MSAPTPLVRAFSDLTIRIRMAAKEIIRVADQLSASEDLTHAEMTLLMALENLGDTTVPDIARLRRMKRQSIQVTVDQMAERGLVSRVPNPAHRRSKLIRATKAGVAARRTIERRRAKSMVQVSRGLKRRDVELATKVLEDVTERLRRVHPSE